MEYLVAQDRFETEGFVLRSYLPGDGAKLFEAVDASRDHLAPWMPWIEAHSDAEASERFVRQARGKFLLARNFILAIFPPDESELWGGCGYHLREGGLKNRAAEMGMWIRASQAGRGLGTRVLEAMIRWGFAEWPWLRLTWHCDGRNLASYRVAEKAGMRLEGTLRRHFEARDGERRDTRCYAILKEEQAEA